MRDSEPSAVVGPVLTSILVQWINFPEIYFNQTSLTKTEITNGFAAIFLSLKKLHGGKTPYSQMQIGYNPAFYGATQPNGIIFGDAAFPNGNNGSPRWEVGAHENGHNFFGGQYWFYGQLCFPDPSRPNQPGQNPFLQEALAVFSAFYVYNDIKNNRNQYPVTDAVFGSMSYDFNNGRNYQESQYNKYVNQGNVFNFYSILTSQTLNTVMIKLGEQFGFDKYTNFRWFDHPFVNNFTFHQDGAAIEEQSTFIIAVLAKIFPESTVLGYFSSLKFPIITSLYNSIKSA